MSSDNEKPATRCVWSSCCGLLACILYRRPVTAVVHEGPPKPAVVVQPHRDDDSGDGRPLSFCACACDEVTIGVRASAV
jgi:hypothetical protein